MSNPTELPDLDALRKLGSMITTQDNRITEAPIFVVEQKTPVISDSDYNDCRVEWRETENGDYQLASSDRAERLEALHRAGRETHGWRRYEVTDIWTFVTACFTEQGCLDYLERNGHNLRETRIYAYGSYRNEEFRTMRTALVELARRAQPEGAQQAAAPADCSGTPSSCPDNEGYGCHCSAPGTPEAPADDAKDAARYRWLRDNCYDFDPAGDGDAFDHPALHFESNELDPHNRGSLDLAIDTDMHAAQLDGGQEGSAT